MKHGTEIRIGTSGWHYKHWVGRFYPERCSGPQMLCHYLEHFDTVEINNSFYKLPEVATFRAWHDAVPRDFCFAVKASRFITHNKKLKDPENALNNFLPRAETLGNKLGPVLFQLPPKWGVNVARLEEFLCALPKNHRYAFEFRETSWNTEAVYKVLSQHNAAFCIYELAGYASPLELTADWTYVRLHGPGGKYQGSYPTETLMTWADRIAKWSSKLKAVYFYLDNDDSAYAAHNAIKLKQLVSERLGTKRAA